VFEYGNYVVVILTNILQSPAEKTVDFLFREAEIRKIKIVAGISRVASNIQDFKFFLEEAIESLQIGQAMYRSKPATWSLDRLGFFYPILKKGNQFDEKNHYCEMIKQIETYDIQHKTEYLKTVTVYLENMMDAKKTSGELFIHRNTLRQRIQKIISDWDIDFSDSISMINLLIAIKSTLVCSFYSSDLKNDQGNLRNRA
jgi:DNA-binding PucR family transcriptional regulator